MTLDQIALSECDLLKILCMFCQILMEAFKFTSIYFTSFVYAVQYTVGLYSKRTVMLICDTFIARHLHYDSFNMINL